MELIIFFAIFVVIIAAVGIGLVLMRTSNRLRKHGGDRQAYKRPPCGSRR